MSFETVVQQALFTALDGNISAGVYDDVPFQPNGDPVANFPYVTIGAMQSWPWDTDDTVGQNVTTSIHVWSRAAGMKETKAILGEIYTLLDRSSPSITGYNVIDFRQVHTSVVLELDGRTRHGIGQYRMTIQKTS